MALLTTLFSEGTRRPGHRAVYAVSAAGAAIGLVAGGLLVE